ATACCACCWWKRRKPQFVTIPSFAKSICIAATRSRKRWLKWQRRASWRYGCTGCCVPSSRIQPLFASRAARGCPWSARARPKELIGRSRIPHRRDVRIAESWPSVRSNRWLVERLHRRVIQVRFPESWSSTFSGEKAVLTHRPGYFCLDNAFALIEGHPSAPATITSRQSFLDRRNDSGEYLTLRRQTSHDITTRTRYDRYQS